MISFRQADILEKLKPPHVFGIEFYLSVAGFLTMNSIKPVPPQPQGDNTSAFSQIAWKAVKEDPMQNKYSADRALLDGHSQKDGLRAVNEIYKSLESNQIVKPIGYVIPTSESHFVLTVQIR